MKKKSAIWLGIGLVILVVSLTIWYATSAVSIPAVQADSGAVIIELEETGYTESIDSYTLESPKTARIVEISTGVGDAVGPDQSLILLENVDADNLTIPVKSQITSIESQILGIEEQLEPVNVQIADRTAQLRNEMGAVENLRIQKEESQRSFERTEALYNAGAISKSDYEAAEYDLETVTNDLNTHQDNLDQISGSLDSLGRYKEKLLSDAGTMNGRLVECQSDLEELQSELVISSITDGRILELPVKVGEVVLPGTALVKIGGTSMLQIKADILSDDMAGIQLGQKVRINAPVLGDQILEGQVKQIYPSAFEKVSALGVIQRRVTVVIAFSNIANLKPGYEVTVKIATDQRSNVLRLPRASVRSRADGGYEVLRIVDGQIEIARVDIGLKNQDWVEITGGLQKGDLVVKDASQNLASGTSVKPAD